MMDWIFIIRIVIFVTFLLLLVESVGIMFWARHAWKRYLVAHKELEVRVEALERRHRGELNA
jgi:hypothetical protein